MVVAVVVVVVVPVVVAVVPVVVAVVAVVVPRGAVPPRVAGDPEVRRDRDRVRRGLRVEPGRSGLSGACHADERAAEQHDHRQQTPDLHEQILHVFDPHFRA